MNWQVEVVLFVLGAIVGSFLNVCIFRLPLQESIVFPSSRCMGCGTHIPWHDNIPIFAWLWLRGRCRHCQAPISIQYPIIEALAGVVAVTVCMRFGLTRESLALVVLGYGLIVLTVIDFYHYILPDVITKPGMVLGLLLAGQPLVGLPAFAPPLATWQNAAMGVFWGYWGLWLFAWIFEKITGKVGMGLGDVKLLAMIGAWLGWQALPFTLFGGAFLGSIVGVSLILFAKRDEAQPIPFGPYLAVAAWVYLFFGDAILNWYWQKFIVGT
ncbi:MAG: prepilin peptidase [Magnetococcales bacterium]|nr:prepilin peptidase [Magnetococcales bacterium]MBF0321446.1 prepilin peptidase [Magnetococcales bacterium]